VDVVILPLLNHSETVSVALKRMREAERSGIVRHNKDDTHTLFYAGDLLRAAAKRVRRLADVREGEHVVLLDIRRAQKFKLDIVRPLRTASAYETMFASAHADYALVGETWQSAMIVTSSEDKTADLSMTGGYECTGKPRHYFPRPRVKVGQSCPLRPECKLSGGVPTIRPA
jgi:hypothetical protein